MLNDYADAEHPIVIYDYQQGRSATHPAEFLKNYNGYLHTDGYAGYHKLPESITVVGCWAHARRYFEEAAQALNYAQKQRKYLEALLPEHISANFALVIGNF